MTSKFQHSKRFLCLLACLPLLGRAQVSPADREATLKVMHSPHLAMDLVMALQKEEIYAAYSTQAQLPATVQFLRNRGVPTTVPIETRLGKNGSLPILIIPRFEGDRDFLFFPYVLNIAQQVSGGYTFLPLFGDLNNVAYTLSLLNDTTVVQEEEKLRQIIEASEPYSDPERWKGKFQKIGLGPIARLKQGLASICRVFFGRTSP